jgi:hypothetical protein
MSVVDCDSLTKLQKIIHSFIHSYWPVVDESVAYVYESPSLTVASDKDLLCAGEKPEISFICSHLIS